MPPGAWGRRGRAARGLSPQPRRPRLPPAPPGWRFSRLGPGLPWAALHHLLPVGLNPAGWGGRRRGPGPEGGLEGGWGGQCRGPAARAGWGAGSPSLGFSSCWSAIPGVGEVTADLVPQPWRGFGELEGREAAVKAGDGFVNRCTAMP